jgi:hypothetical protein
MKAFGEARNGVMAIHEGELRVAFFPIFVNFLQKGDNRYVFP